MQTEFPTGISCFLLSAETRAQVEMKLKLTLKLTFNMLKFNSTATSGEHINILPNLQWIRCPLQPLRMENTLSEVGMISKITHICAICHFSLVEELTFEWKVFVLLNLEDTEGCKTKKDKTRRGKTTKRQDQEKFGWTIPSCSGS